MSSQCLLGWGNATDGQLGSSTSEIITTPRPVAGLSLKRIPTSFSAGLWGSVIVTDNGSAVFYTPNGESSTHTDSVSSISLPSPRLVPGTAIPPDQSQLPSITSVSCGQDFTLFRAACGSLYSSGENSYGQLGRGHNAPAINNIPQKIETLADIKIVTMAAAQFHWLAVDTLGRVFACGENRSGQLGLAHTNNVFTPTYVHALWPHPIVTVSTGDSHSAALSACGTLLCFGSNKLGQLGQSSFKVQVCSLTPVPVPVPQGSRPSETGRTDVDLDGDVQMEVETNENQLPPAKRKPPSTSYDHIAALGPSDPLANATDASEDHNEEQLTLSYIDVACGNTHTVALRNDGTLVCWGNGKYGQLGTRVTRNMFSPTPISSPAQFVSVSAGHRHSAALSVDGEIYAWGNGSMGQIGDGDVSDKYVPVILGKPRIPSEQQNENDATMDEESSMVDESQPYRYVQVKCGGYHTIALVANDSIPVYEAHHVYENRIPRCSVDSMVQARAGFNRFGSSAVLLRSFIRPNIEQLARGKVDYVKAETAHIAFARMFGDEGKKILGLAAARIRHEAQVAFGLVRNGDSNSLSARDSLDNPAPLVTPKTKFMKGDDNFQSSVANYYECGYLFFLALMNPIYAEVERVPELSELAAILLKCEEEGREAFIEMVSQCDEQVLLTRFVRPLQTALSDELRGYRRITANAVFVTKMLALCYHGVWRASRRKNLQGFIIPRQEFYNHTVSEMVNFEQDYERWLEAQASLRRRQMKNDRSSGEDSNDQMETDFSKTNNNSLFLPDLPPLPSTGQPDARFSFCSYSFLLSESAKFQVLGIESRQTMSEESRRSFITLGTLPIPSFGPFSGMRGASDHLQSVQFLVIRVRREHIVSDSFSQVAKYAQRHQRELRKPLKVIFLGEDGVDEGGVSKEFYQVFLERILSADYGMFRYDEDSHFHWFRKEYFEPDESWTIIGIMFGLAAFNSILLDVQFPPVVYRKLERELHIYQRLADSNHNNNSTNLEHNNDNNTNGNRGNRYNGNNYNDEDHSCPNCSHILRSKKRYKATLDDVKETFPAIGNSLQHLLEYEGDDVEEVFCLTFEITYTDPFGTAKAHELLPNGAQIGVTNENRRKFVALYIDYLINSSIERSFENFALGFSFMLNGPFVKTFTAEELETLVTGEKELDFGALRQSTKYEGYSEASQVIIYLWQVLGEFDGDLKRQFLSFVTGTDRAPIGGLSKLPLIIQRAEGDSNRLPQSHTCFNVLLLPEYGTRAKLRDRLTLAIQNSKGFGLR